MGIGKLKLLKLKASSKYNKITAVSMSGREELEENNGVHHFSSL